MKKINCSNKDKKSNIKLNTDLNINKRGSGILMIVISLVVIVIYTTTVYTASIHYNYVSFKYKEHNKLNYEKEVEDIDEIYNKLVQINRYKDIFN